MTGLEGYRYEMPGGTGWATMVHSGQQLRLECLGTGGNVTMLLFNLHDRLERLNIPDTLKAQMSARIRPPMVLMSDLGRAMFSVTGASLPWHDAMCGFGPVARRLLLDELLTYGLGRRDLSASVNWFSKVVVEDERQARLRYLPQAGRGDWVTLRAEQDLLVVLATAPHPLDPAPADPAPGVMAPGVLAPGVLATVSTPDTTSGPDDPSRAFRPESARALALAERSRR